MKRHLTSAIRQLWKRRLFTMLNVSSLAISISACWVIFRIVDYEFSYDRGHLNQKNIYRVVSGFIFNEKESYNGGVSAPMYQGVRQQVSGLDYAVPLLGKWVSAVEISRGPGEPVTFEEPGDIVATDVSYFKMIPYRWLAGNKWTALAAPGNVVLTEGRARQYFPGKKISEIFGKRVTYYAADTVQRTVTGIVADLKAPTEFTAQEFCTLPAKAYELSAWTNTNGSDKLYLQLKPGAGPGSIVKQIDRLAAAKYKDFKQKQTEAFEFKSWYQLLPLRDSHFSTYINERAVRKASKPANPVNNLRSE
jgi:putative ABC transport system permease protein